MKQPQEIETLYVLPCIRKELAKSLIKEHHLNQQEAAKALGITKAAVNQYIKSKRASRLKFSQPVLKEIKKSASIIIKNSKALREEIQRVCNVIKKKSVLCQIHRKYEDVEKACKVCLR